MYLKKTAGPRVVTLPDGRTLSRGDLPSPGTIRWTPKRKVRVAEAVRHGLVTPDEAAHLYDLDDEELSQWLTQLDRHGPNGLKFAHSRAIRRAKRENVNF